MRTEIHPKYYPNAVVTCSCGNSWTTGSTHESIRTDVCSQCHPFFTGEQRIIDTAGQVDRFMKRLDSYSAHQSDATKRQKVNQKKTEQRFLKQQLAALDLSDGVSQVLHDNNIITVGDLAKKIDSDRAELLTFKGFDEQALNSIETKLTEAKESYFAVNS